MSHSDLNLEDILSDRRFEEDFLEVPIRDYVFRVCRFFAVGISIAVLIQLFFLGVRDREQYDRRAFANITDERVSVAPRGIIVDRYGEFLVTNEASFAVIFSPQDAPLDPRDRIVLIRQFSNLLNIPYDVLSERLLRYDWHVVNTIVLSNNATHDQLVAFAAASLPGVTLEPTFRRVHARPYVFSHLAGYTGLVTTRDITKDPHLAFHDSIGRGGIEAYYDSAVRGRNGKELIIRDARGRMYDRRRIELPREGARLETFIDRELQEFLYDRLQITLRSLGRQIAAGVILNPQNGEVLALVSIPSFDSTQVARALTDPLEPLFNRVVSGRYAPGSTIKPLHALAALVEQIIEPAKQIFSAGFIEIPNPFFPDQPSRFLDWKAHGWVDIHAALARSSNVYFYEVGGGFKNQIGLGVYRLKQWWEKFGLNQKTNIDLLGEAEGFLPDPVSKEHITRVPWRIGDTYNVSIGQGDLVITPLELLTYVSALAEGNVMYQPRIMKQIVDVHGTVISKSEPVALRTLPPGIDAALSEIREGMRDAVSKPYGTAYLLHDIPLPIMAKTGSSQVANNTRVNAFFVGFTADFAVVLLVENAREGSLNVVPVAKDIFSWYNEHRVQKSG